MRLYIVSISGGLGNQMFQYAFYLGLKYYLFPKDCSKIFIAPYNNHNGYELDKVFNIKNNIITNLVVGFLKKYFKSIVFKKQEQSVATFEQLIHNNKKPITYYSGFWQTEKYFSQIEDIIRLTFKFDLEKISDRNKTLIVEMKSKNAVSLHVRRGDYESDQGAKYVLGGNCDLDYYEKCINYVNENIKNPFFYIFSDDPDWTKDNFSFLKNSCFVNWNKKKDCWQDMMLMSYCNHNIIANSSFSWWGAWLNSHPEKIVLAPSKWFNIYPGLDIVPDSWIKM